MHVRQLIQDDDAVSPVIGVILMVAITVILAAVIGTFVLGLGEQIQQTTPQATFSWDSSGVTHAGGDSIKDTNFKISGGDPQNSCDSFSGECIDGDTWTAGETITLNSTTSGTTVQIIWQSGSSDKSAILGQHTY